MRHGTDLKLYQVFLKGVTAGVEVSPDGVVVDAAPVLKKFIGVRLDKLRNWVTGKGGQVNAVGGANESGREG